ncbi:MAG: PilT/PilU family type 4a pilus ATPase [Myxococcales bacterium]|nr:PilT/PilU family type 4a pilus ATPase [Myxococcales bacterium]
MTQPPSTVRRLLASMERWGASDVFVCEGKPPAARVHGRVVPVELPATTAEDMSALVDEVMSPTARAQLEANGDADVGYSIDGTKRFRFNFARQKGVLSFVARALPSGRLDLAQLGLPPVLGALADLPRGLVLVTGATGSGKSTTLAAIVNRINETRQAHIVTIEDPVEFVHTDIQSRVTQREVGADTRDFAHALRQVVRQSPDVILIGEMRDVDTMQTAIAAALTGHLVFATLHTIDAAQTLQRILAYFPDHMRHQAALDLSLCLQAVVSQRLIPRSDGTGRAVATELLTVTPGVRRLIREQRVDEVHDMLRASSDPGLRSFNASVLDLFKAGVISLDVGKAYATNAEEFTLATQGMTTGIGTFSRDGVESVSGLDMKALLTLALEKGASDLHLTVGRPPIFRIAGELHPLRVRPLSDADLRTLLFSILTTTQRSQYELEREIDFALSIDRETRFRVNAYYQKGKMACALRAIASTIPDPAELGIPDVVVDLASRSQGLLLVVGPTGSGKSTTLACLVDRINSERACRIITVEDPIEFTHEGKLATVDQREVHADTTSFAAALKYVLRQDPDVILIGEMRDLETIGAAMTAAETGHLVLATLHTNDAIQAVDRVVDAFPAHQQSQVRSQLAACLLGVVSQRLLPRADGYGRIAAFEVMVASPAIRTLIRDDKMHQAVSMMETRLGDGMLTMDRSLAELTRAGYITREEAMRYISNPKLITELR